jgi:hypothetical protein
MIIIIVNLYTLYYIIKIIFVQVAVLLHIQSIYATDHRQKPQPTTDHNPTNFYDA